MYYTQLDNIYALDWETGNSFLLKKKKKEKSRVV